MGKPCKLTAEVHNRIVASLRAGAYKTVAASEAGISTSTFSNWMERGAMEEARIEEGFAPNPEETKFLELKQEADIARAKAEIEAVRVIRDAGRMGTWQAAAWYLERSFPQRWSKARPVEEVPADKETADPDDAMNKLLERIEALADRQHEP